MPELTDAQLDELIAAIGLTEPKPQRELKPCGTPAAYARHLKLREEPCDACRAANTDAKRRGSTPTPRLRKPIDHGTPKGAKQHRYRREPLCPACREAQRDRYHAGKTYLTEEEWQARRAAKAGNAT